MKIRDVLDHLPERIEEIIKLDQTDEQAVYTELSEYVATPRIADHYYTLLKEIAASKTNPHEGIGVWISGFFGSGKSSFAKNLGYVLANRAVLGKQASELFKRQVQDARVSNVVDLVNAMLPVEPLMFDISVDRAVRNTSERIAEVMYRVLLRELGYAEDYDLAELEIELEGEQKLEEFERRVQETYNDSWTRSRKGAQKFNRASAILHQMDPATYPSAETWAQTVAGKSSDFSVAVLVERTFELARRRRPGKAIVFIVDEVGQYVARSGDKILDLQAVVREFGPVGRNKVNARQAVAPVWVVVTSQEKLDEIVSALDERRIELAKLQDSFKYRVDLAPADIREIATRRVLQKSPQGAAELKRRYEQHQGQLNIYCHLERSALPSAVSEDEFVQFYPYLPHYVELSIDIMSGIRLQPGANRQLGGSNRTIIKQIHEMLVSDRTHLAEVQVGRLVTLDLVYDLVEGSLSSEKRRDVGQVEQSMADDPWCARVVKAIALLEFVRGLPRSEVNLAAVLYGQLGAPSPLEQVQTALARLEQGQFIRQTDEGWKLLTAQEKNWDAERRSLAPRAKDRNEIKRELLGQVFDDPHLKSYRFRGLRTFKLGVKVDGVALGGEGEIPLSVVVADDPSQVQPRGEEALDQSRDSHHQNELLWVMGLSAEIDDLVAELFRSREMLRKYDNLSAHGKISADDSASLASERGQATRLEGRLRERLEQALRGGIGYFRGSTRHGSELGKTVAEAFGTFFDFAVPMLYPKLELGTRSLKGTEADELLRAANLNGLPQVFHDGQDGLGLVVHKDGRYVLNPDAEVAREVLGFLRAQQLYGTRVTGKGLDEKFGGLGYGWQRDVVQVVLAALLRAGAIEVSSQGRRFRNHLDPQARQVFSNQNAFKAASFVPRKSIDLRTLTQAVRAFEDLTGGELEVEESAIAAASKEFANDELERLHPIRATLVSNGLPGLDLLDEYRATLEDLRQGESDDAVRTLAGEGLSLKEARDRVGRIEVATGEAGLKRLRAARTALEQQWPVLEAHPDGRDLSQDVARLREHLQSPTLYEAEAEVDAATRGVQSAYHQVYEHMHEQRTLAYQAAIEAVRGRPEWVQLEPPRLDGQESPGSEEQDRYRELRDSLLRELKRRACHPLEFSDESLVCATCRASVSQMESDLAATGGLQNQALRQLQEATTPTEEREQVRVVRLAGYFTRSLDSEQAVSEALDRLREDLLTLLAEGRRIVLE